MFHGVATLMTGCNQRGHKDGAVYNSSELMVPVRGCSLAVRVLQAAAPKVGLNLLRARMLAAAFRGSAPTTQTRKSEACAPRDGGFRSGRAGTSRVRFGAR